MSLTRGAMLEDLKHAGRRLRRDRASSIVAVAILGATLGANAILIAFVSGYFLKPLPIPRAADHVEILARDAAGGLRDTWSRAEVAHLQSAGAGVLEHVYGAAERHASAFPLSGTEPVAAFGAVVTGEYFGLFRPSMALGAIPRPAPGSGEPPPVAVVLSDAGWTRLAAARPDVVGQSLRIDGAFFVVAGVAAPDARGIEPITPDFWVSADAYELAVDFPGSGPGLRYVAGGILRDGVSLEATASALTAAFASLPGDAGPAPAASAVVLPRPTLVRERAELAPVVALLLAAFALMTVTACANLSGMSLAQATARTRELAMRYALGASRTRVVRPVLFEHLALAGAGALLGCAVGAVAVTSVHAHVFSLVTSSGLTVSPISVDWRVWLSVTGLAMVVGLVCAAPPALAALTLQPSAPAALGGSSLRAGSHPHRALHALVTSQAAISVALLVAAGITVTNALRAPQADTGYALASLVDLGAERPTPALVDRLSRDPGVESVTTVRHTPLAGQAGRIGVTVDGRRLRVASNVVDHRFFDTTGIPVRRGRAFTPGDAAADIRRVVINEGAARRLWPDADPLGAWLEIDPFSPRGSGPERYEVIGIAADAMHGWFFEDRDLPMVYLTTAVASPVAGETLVRWRGDSAGARQRLQAICQEHDPASLCRPTTLDALLARQQVPFTISAQIASGLGVVTLALACLGLYGLVSFAVVRRTPEIGVRMALGASPRRILLEVLRGASARMALGAAAGLPVCLGLLAWLESRIAFFDTFDLRVYVLAPALLVTAGLAAALLPAGRAARVDPLVALRRE